MGSIEQEIEYWSVQKNTLAVRNYQMQDRIDQIEHDQKVAKDLLKELVKSRGLNEKKMGICDEHISLLNKGGVI